MVVGVVLSAVTILVVVGIVEMVAVLEIKQILYEQRPSTASICSAQTTEEPVSVQLERI